jgi:hypothetical protein
MNLKLKRAVRTPYSEEIAIFDGDTRDENEDAVNIGKLDVHYLADQITGTLLIWQEFADGYKRTHGPGSEETLDDLIDAILTEVVEPVGVPSEYGIEIYFPSVANQAFVSNYAPDEDEEALPSEGEEDAEAEDEYAQEDEQPRDDKYYQRLRERP